MIEICFWIIFVLRNWDTQAQRLIRRTTAKLDVKYYQMRQKKFLKERESIIMHNESYITSYGRTRMTVFWTRVLIADQQKSYTKKKWLCQIKISSDICTDLVEVNMCFMCHVWKIITFIYCKYFLRTRKSVLRSLILVVQWWWSIYVTHLTKCVYVLTVTWIFYEILLPAPVSSRMIPRPNWVGSSEYRMLRKITLHKILSGKTGLPKGGLLWLSSQSVWIYTAHQNNTVCLGSWCC
jgi:hypothetical protein